MNIAWGRERNCAAHSKIRFSCVSACVRGCPAVDYRMADFPLGLSFDDVLLLPRLSAILPGDADISSQLVPGFDMKIPVLSAAMDTVSESELAIAPVWEDAARLPLSELPALIAAILHPFLIKDEA